MVQTCRYAFYLDSILLKIRYFFWHELWFFVSVAERPNLLRVHPIKHSLFPSVSPGPHVTIICQSVRVEFAQGHVNDFEAQLVKFGYKSGLIEPDIGLVPISENSPVALSKHVELTIF